MPDTARKRPKKVRIHKSFIKTPGPASRDRTHRDAHTDNDDTDTETQGSAYAESDTSVDMNTLNEIEERGLSVTVALQPRDVQATIQAAAPEAINSRLQAANCEEEKFEGKKDSSGTLCGVWKARRTTITDMSAEVELFSIHSVELSDEHSQHGRITITYDEGPSVGGASQANSKLCRWLHIQQSLLSLEDLKKFVMSCSYIAPELQEVAAQLLTEVRTKFTLSTNRGPHVEAGAVLRYIGILPHVGETEPVIFASCPHLVLGEKRSTLKGDGQAPQTLFQYLYGLESESNWVGTRVKHDLDIGGPNKMIHVNQIWCLLMGSGCLITYSPKSASELQEGLIHQVPSKAPDHGFLSMVLIDGHNFRFNGFVGKDWTYVDLLQYAVGRIRKRPWEASRFYLESPSGERLSAKLWLKLVTSGSTDLGVFHIRRSKEGERFTPVVDNYTSNRFFGTLKQGTQRTGNFLNSRIPRLATRLPDGRPSLRRQKDHSKHTKAEEPAHGGATKRDTADFDPKIDPHSIDSGDHDPSRRDKTPPGSDLVNQGFECMTGLEREFSLGDAESVVENDSVQLKPRDIQPIVYAPSPEDRTKWESSGELSLESIRLDEFQDGLSELNIRHIGPQAVSETNLVPITKPFFEWRANGTAAHRSIDEIRMNMGSILQRLHHDMMDDGSRYIYSSAFRCSRGVLWLRNSFLPLHESRAVYSLDTEIHVEQDFTDRTIYMVSASNTEQQDRENNEATNIAPTNDDVDRVEVVDSTENVKDIMTTLFEVSRRLVSCFLPEMEIPRYHDVLGSLWGSLDTIFRQLKWESLHGEEHHTSHYILRDFDPFTTHSESALGLPSGSFQSWSQCEECSQHKIYSSIESALGHLHKRHFLCEGNQPVRRPFDDPCYVWILHVAKVGDGKAHPLLSLTKDFAKDLQDIYRIVKELHALVARPGNSPDADQIIPPLLPGNLVLAFSEIVKVYTLHSNQLSLMNQSKYPNMHSSRKGLQDNVARGIKAAEARRIAAMTTARELLEFSHRDIMMLKHTTQEVHHSVVETVGLEFLTLALMSNAQKQPIVSKPTAISIEDIYRIQMSRMQFAVSQMPTRRLFLHLGALQEELNAVDRVIEAQQSLLNNYLDLLAPSSFGNLNSTRVKLYAAERKFEKRHEMTLQEVRESLNYLQERATAMTEQVKQRIEIVEENHGKAIRVFTIVTLFFLPMSFISSFLGMNTRDIRDTELDQRLFWIVSIPFTVLVVVLAMAYGYNDGSVTHWIDKNFYSRVVHVTHTDHFESQAAPPSGGIQRSRTMELQQQLLQMRLQNNRGSRFRGRRRTASQTSMRK